MRTPFVGIDFGTTNSAIAVAGEDGRIRLARFRTGEVEAEVFRSVLYLEPVTEGRANLEVVGGHEAIVRYLDGDGGRLIQSMKSFLPSRSVDQVVLFGRTYRYEEILGKFLSLLRRDAERSLGPLGDRAVVGRPVEFVKNAAGESDALALDRLRAAYAIAGFHHVEFQLEPVAAALAYEARLDRSQLVLVGDFGGGTSDFCVMQLGVAGGSRILSTAGVGIAGDTFDGRIVRRAVAPTLGLGSWYVASGKRLEVPGSIYRLLERWHHLSFLREKETMHLLLEIAATSEAPDAIQRLIRLVRDNLGFELYRAVERAKTALSAAGSTALAFAADGVDVRATVTRAQFEEWIAPDLDRIRAAVDESLEKAGVAAGDVQRVFLTGGSSLVPAVRRLFDERFGSERVSHGDELTSVVYGLAADARARDAA